MKLVTYNALNTRTISTQPAITFSKNNQITISSAAIDFMHLKNGDYILFHQDAATRKDWYIEKDNKKEGIRVRFYKYKTGFEQIKFNNKVLVRELYRSLGIPVQTKRFRIIKKNLGGRELFQIVTSGNAVNRPVNDLY